MTERYELSISRYADGPMPAELQVYRVGRLDMAGRALGMEIHEAVLALQFGLENGDASATAMRVEHVPGGWVRSDGRTMADSLTCACTWFGPDTALIGVSRTQEGMPRDCAWAVAIRERGARSRLGDAIFEIDVLGTAQHGGELLEVRRRLEMGPPS